MIEFVIALLIILAIVIPALVVWRRSAGKASALPPGNAQPTFNILEWNGRLPPTVPPSANPPPVIPGSQFAGMKRQVNPEARCLLTGLTAADCTCPTHRSVT